MTPHLTIGYTGYTRTGEHVSRIVTVSLDTQEAIGAGEWDLNRLLLDVDNIIDDHADHLSTTCHECNGTGMVYGYVGVEPVTEPCPACDGGRA